MTCPLCDDTGDIHDLAGEWRGECEHDPAFSGPLPAIEYLDRSARRHGFADWFAVPAFIQTPENRRVIVDARAMQRREFKP